MPVQTYRPKLEIQPSPVDMAVEIMAVAGLVVHAIMLAHFWPMIPHTVATHFGANGKPDGWGPKNTMLMLPVLSVVIWGVFTVLNRFPHIFNYPVRLTPENAERQYKIATSVIRWLKMEIIWVFILLNYESILVSLGKARGLDYSIWFVVVMSVSTIIFLIKAYRAK